MSTTLERELRQQLGDQQLSSSESRSWTSWIPLALTLALGLACVRALVPWGVGLRLLVCAVWFVAPGAVVVGRVYGWRRAGMAWSCAPGWGYLLSSVALLCLWASGAQSWPVLVAAPLAAVPVAWVAGGLVTGRVEAPAFTRRDVVWLGSVLLLVPLVVGWPYARVGEVTPLGQHYRAYFTADFVWAMAAVAEVSKGAIPPVNPFRLATPMHYYWLAHLFPAAEYRWLEHVVALRHVLLVNAVFAGLVFVAWLYGFARNFVARPWTAAAGVAAAILATSFEGLQQIVELWWLHAPVGHFLRVMNIDAVTRWVFHGMPVDGLQRLLLYQPQHQLGYATALTALLLVKQARRSDTGGLGLIVGATLGGSFLLSTFSALMATVAVALFLGYRILREGALRRAWWVAVAAAIPLVLAVLLTRVLQYVDTTGGSLVRLGLNPVSIRHVVTDFAFGLGPLVVVLCAAVAFLVWKRQTMEGTAPLWLTVGTSFAFYFFADVRDHQDVYVGWRAGHFLFITMAAIVARLVETGLLLPPAARRFAAITAGVVVLAALPTPLIDLYNTQDIWNLAETAAGRWTLVVSPDEGEALGWVRKNVPLEATIQVDPIVRNPETWAYVPAFAERRMAAGLPISMIPLAPYEEASRRVVGLYRAASAEDVSQECLRHGVDYLLVGPPERKGHPDFEPLIAKAPELLAPVFQNATVTIYHVEGAKH